MRLESWEKRTDFIADVWPERTGKIRTPVTSVVTDPSNGF
jgi:hypothetical protein